MNKNINHTKMKKTIWITWENQVRNKTMSTMLGAELYSFTCGGGRFKRYLFCGAKTLITLLKVRPQIVFVQNPSVILNYFLITAKIYFRYKLVSDAHYAGLIAFNGNKLLQRMLNICNRLVDLVIVTNVEHESHIQRIGGEAVICEDPLPDIDKYRVEEEKDKMVLFICSFDVDEPYEYAFKAGELLVKENFIFCVSGNYNKAKINPLIYPHIKFLGYLPENEFYAALFHCSVVLDLTENENCLLCGAYEAMAAEKPLVTSNTECLINYFSSGTVFTNHDPINIANAIKKAYANKLSLTKEIVRWKSSTLKHINCRIDNIYKRLDLDR